MNESNGFKNFCLEHKGAIIGGLVAIIIVCTGLLKVLFVILAIIIGVLVGNYIQKNKEFVKEKLKSFIDKF